MSGWIVYSKDGSIERCKLKSLEYGGTAMGERAVTATFDYHSEVAFEVFDYIEYRGERFELEAVPTVKKLSSFEYQYELRFVSLKYELERCEMRDLVPSDNGVVYPTPLTFSFTGNVRYLTDRIQACLDAMYGTDVWKITIAEGTSSEENNITIAQQNCWNALALVNSTYGLNFYIKGRTITIGGEQPLVSHTFEYGKGNGLYEIERASDTETGIVTKLRAYGSTRNLDYSYPKKPEWSDSVLPVSFALSPLRLMLPSFKDDGKTDYVLADDAAIAKYGIREASMVYDDIYPSIAGATYNGQAIDEIKAVDAVDESQKTFVVYLHELGFDLEEHLTTSDAQISMKSGALQGYTFTISTIEKQTGGYKITLGKNSLENSEESGAYVPGVNWNMKAGDKFVLLNILMPQKYIRDAENRLLARAEEYLAQYSKTNFSYNIGMHDKFLIQNPSVYDSLIEGSKLKVYDKEIGIDEEVTIQSITITENLEDNILPQVKVTLNNEPSASTLDRIQGKLNEVAAETAANGFTTQSEIMAQYRRKLDKPFFDKLFVAIDANGNEIPSTDVITPIAYIKAKYHVASVGGFTMYAMDKDVNVTSLASGLPFDGRTIWYNPDTQQIEVIGGTGGGSGEGVSNFWDLSGIPSWITNSKPKYTYSEIEGTPDLTKYALVSQIPSLSGYATESWVTKQNYATKSTTLSGYGITDAYTKTNVDDLLRSYVTLGGTPQTITGEKNFTGGLKVNGSPIYYDREKKYWKLEGDLLVTGGVTMYGSDSSFTPSTIMDAILYDSATLGINSNGQLYVKGGTSGGGLDITALQNYLTQNSYLNVTEGDNRYLMLSGGTINGKLAIKNSTREVLDIISTDIYGPLVKLCYYNNVALSSFGHIRKATESNLGAYWMNNESGCGIMLGSDGKTYIFTNQTVKAEHEIWHKGNFTPSNYLPLSGGTISNNGYALILNRESENPVWIQFRMQNEFVGAIGGENGALRFMDKNSKVNTVWHSGNDGGGSGLDADLLDGKHLSDIIRYEGLNNNGNNAASAQTITYWGEGNWGHGSTYGTSLNIQGAGSWNHRIDFRTDGKIDYYQGINTGDMSYIGQLAFTSSNVASATKLQTTRTIWGQSFDGSGNVDGNMIVKGKYVGITFQGTNPYNTGIGFNDYEGNVRWYLSYRGLSAADKDFYIYRYTDDNSYHVAMSFIRSNGNVGIGTTNPAYKLDVNGTIRFASKTLWGQSFDGTGNVNGNMNGVGIVNSFLNIKQDGSSVSHLFLTNPTSNVDYGHIYVSNYDNSRKDRPLVLQNGYGNVGIGITNPSYKLDVNGGAFINGELVSKGGVFGGNGGSNPANYWWGLYQWDSKIQFSRRTTSNGYESDYFYIDVASKNIVFSAGITMYSDQRKKTILNHVELSLKQIAEAPLIEHYYNSDDKKTTHVGSIAQYWASMNDWFCKLDSEGYYTMEIQNAALASAISIARELDRYETKTDKAIKKLKKRICELEEEVERLRAS